MKKSWTYEAAGVPHLKGDPGYNRKITDLIRSTRVPGVMGSATGFAALFDASRPKLKNPVLVSSTDGVGTKLEVARLQKRHDTVGIDLVAMCVNDVLTLGARPIFFLDYFASGKFDPQMTFEVLKGIAEGCRQAACGLVGGETAIMPGFYQAEGEQTQYDIAGFSVGIVEKKKIITGAKIRKGHKILGLASSGFHSNGFSLLRKIFSEKELAGEIGRELLVPTKIYVKPVLKLIKEVPVEGIANITGGGFLDNIPRILPEGLAAIIHEGSWMRPKIFDLVQDSGNISKFEMARTFNLGIGMVIVLDTKHAQRAQRILTRERIKSWVIGEIAMRSGRENSVILD